MLKKILTQFTALAAVILAVFFCTSGMTKLPVSSPASAACPEFTTPPVTTAPVTDTELPVQTPTVSFGAAPEGYFEDALFVGDSRTVGLYEYGRIPGATYFATSGMSVYSIFDEKVGNQSFQELMEHQTFGKIYVMLGINELGYDFEHTIGAYQQLIEWIRRCQPDAIIYIEANLHVSADRSGRDPIYNNRNLDAFNQRISELADGVHIFYLDVNPLFDDDSGNLADQYTVDDTHVLGKYYRMWSKWITENAAVIST